MKFTETRLPEAWVIDLEPIVDQRGFFARSWCRDEFAAHGLNSQLVQCNVSYNLRKGTLRGMHYQEAPHAETKLVRCTSGAIFDVIVDIRKESSTFGKWVGFELKADNHRMLYIPAGFAHGFQTLTDGSEVFYQMSTFYHPDSARGLRWDDPSVGVAWPLSDMILSERDQNFPGLDHLQST